jgi:hypothetical protein
VTALSIPRGAKNPSGALALAEQFTSQPAELLVSGSLNLPSVRRDITAGNTADPYQVVFQNAALSSFTFYDPDPSATDGIFERMVENVSSGKLDVDSASVGANQELSALLGVQ